MPSTSEPSQKDLAQENSSNNTASGITTSGGNAATAFVNLALNGEKNTEDDVSDDSMDEPPHDPERPVGELSSPVSSLTIESSATAKSKHMRKKKVWLLEPIPTKKYVPIPQLDKLR